MARRLLTPTAVLGALLLGACVNGKNPYEPPADETPATSSATRTDEAVRTHATVRHQQALRRQP